MTDIRRPVRAAARVAGTAIVRALIAAMIGLAAAKAGQTAPELPRSGTVASGVFAVVDGTTISAREFDAAYAAAVRQKFYHRAPPEEQLGEFRREVGDKLISRALLIKEAARRGIEPDAKRVAETLAAYDQRYSASPQWQKGREAMLPGLKRELEQQSVLGQLEAKVRAVVDPAEKDVRSYFDEHPELFVEPERVRLSVILLRVDPSSPRLVRDKAREEAAAIVKRLKNGADFAELARLHSGDVTAAKGGDMGFVHRGMLPQEVHQVVDDLKPGVVSPPVSVLEGVAVLRLDDRKPAHRMEFEDVRKRAADLWKREQSESRWRELAARLRKAANVRIMDPSRYPALGDAGTAPRAQSAR